MVLFRASTTSGQWAKRGVFAAWLVCLFFFASPVSAVGHPTHESALQRAQARMQGLHQDLEHHAASVSDHLVILSRYQDAMLAFLHESGSLEEYCEGMEALADQVAYFRKQCNVICSLVNFYSPLEPCQEPQCVPVEGVEGSGMAFLNTFRTGRELTAEEREALYQQEFERYQRDALVERFLLTRESMQELDSERLYNFALLPSGCIWVALEEPGDKEYHAGGAVIETPFAYPNHTILAGSPHQPVLSAGSLMLFRSEGKDLLFVSNKSGHFRPTYWSLHTFRNHVAHQLGVDANTVIPVPDVDLAEAIMTRYDQAEVPVSLCGEDISRLFDLAYERWLAVLAEIDRPLLEALAHGEEVASHGGIEEKIVRWREEANYMRCAYRLFSADHQAPADFHRFVVQFGWLKDAIEHEQQESIPQEAEATLAAMDSCLLDRRPEALADEVSFHRYFKRRLEKIERLLGYDTLHIDNYHRLKKLSREMGALFLYLAHYRQWDGDGFFLYRAAARSFFRINDRMGCVHDEYIGRVLQGETGSEMEYVQLSEGVGRQLRKCINHVGLEPPCMELDFNEERAYALFREARSMWQMVHFEYSVNGASSRPYELLERIASGEIEGFPYWELQQPLRDLRSNARRVSSLFVLLDESESVPERVSEYIRSIEAILDGIHFNCLACVCAEAAELIHFLDNPAWPKRSCEDFNVALGGGNRAIVEQALQDIELLVRRDHLERWELIRVASSTALLSDLFAAFRQCSAAHTLPKVCYASMSTTLDNLHFELESLLGRRINPTPHQSLVVSGDMERLAVRILEKLCYPQYWIVREPLHSS